MKSKVAKRRRPADISNAEIRALSKLKAAKLTSGAIGAAFRLVAQDELGKIIARKSAAGARLYARDIASKLLAGEPLSENGARWLREGLERVGEGEDANVAFGLSLSGRTPQGWQVRAKALALLLAAAAAKLRAENSISQESPRSAATAAGNAVADSLGIPRAGALAWARATRREATE